MGGSPKPGPRDHLVTTLLQAELDGLDRELVDTEALDAAEGPERLARHAMEELRRGLRDGELTADEQAGRINEFLAPLGADADTIALPSRVLRGIRSRSALGDVVALPPLPAVPFSQSDLLVNAEGQPNIGSELRAELATADSVDL